jgi:ABC-type multidrug transport system ATPase subunit
MPKLSEESIRVVIIKTENLTKKFRDLVAVDQVSLEIYEGERFGMLGPNGAGKTSLIRMITAFFLRLQFTNPGNSSSWTTRR